MKVVKLPNLGFCYGVKRAIKIAIDASNDPTIPKPIYLLGAIVHNKFVNDLISSKKIILVEGTNRLKMLNEIPNNSTVLFSAHGVSDKVRQLAKEKNLFIIDSTCPYVEKTFSLVTEKVNEGHKILFIGKDNHPETEAMLELSNNVSLYKKDEVEFKNLTNPLVAHQTTMSCYDIENTFKHIKEKYPDAQVLDMICKTTEKRQTDLFNLAKVKPTCKSIIIIIGDKTSNNSTKLFELATRCEGYDACFIESFDDINLQNIKQYDEAIIGSGTSTPQEIIDEVINCLNNL